MAMTITSNISSLNAQGNLNRASGALATSVERLSSGLKVNRGADGPAALVISEKQRAQIAGLKQAIDNSNKAVSLVQTAEGALGEINDLLVKVRSLAIDSANAGVNDSDALAANQAEITNALDTINRIASNTQFGTKKLLDGSAGLSGISNDPDVTFIRGTTDTSAGVHAVNVTTAAERAIATAGTAQGGNALTANETLTINGVQVTLSSGMSQAAVVNRINEFSSETGAVADANGAGGATRIYSNAFGSNATVNVISNVAASPGGTDYSSGFGTSAIIDQGVDVVATIAGTSYTGTGTTLTANSGVANGLTVRFGTSSSNAAQSVAGAQGSVTVGNNSLVFQIGANQHQTARIAIGKMDASALGLGVAGNQFNNLQDIDVTSASKAQDSLAVIDRAINDVTNQRGALGAFQQNTLTSTANNLRTTLENTTNAESVIRDTDFASEIANYTKSQVLVQAGVSILQNANQAPQMILSLLR
ncbi:flagellin [Planctomicrobium sp. SH668]|uniref:flagellin N-terminal helical domain-containing protein n=1 Tax=Planctomicrobium sp. SH668 TaxID=3448126 RepID=UPI003F5B8B4E